MTKSPGLLLRSHPFIVLVAFLVLPVHSTFAELIGTRVQLGHYLIPGQAHDYNPPFQNGAHSRSYPGGSTSATAGVGTLSIAGNYTSPDVNGLGPASLRLNSYFADTVTINAPGRTGQSGTFKVAYVFDGSYDANSYWNSQVTLHCVFDVDSGVGDGNIPSMSSTAGNIFSYRGDNTYGFSDFSSLFPGEEQTATRSFTFGQPFDFWLKLGAELQTYLAEPGDTRIAISLVKWSGIQNIMAGGVPATDATVSSVSGTNWTQEVTTSLPATTNQIRIVQFVLTPTSVILRGTNGAAHGPYQIRSSSDISQSAEAWSAIYTNRFDTSGGFAATNALLPTKAQEFFRVQ